MSKWGKTFNFAFYLRAYFLSSPYLYVLKYFSHSTRKEGESILKWPLYLHLKRKLYFPPGLWLVKTDQIPFILEQSSQFKGKYVRKDL